MQSKKEYGKRVIIGIPQNVLSIEGDIKEDCIDDFKQFINDHKPQGFTLFKRDIILDEQVQQLISSIKYIYNLLEINFLPEFCIDQEGGIVCRITPIQKQLQTLDYYQIYSESRYFKEDRYPAARFFGDQYEIDGIRATQWTYDNYYTIGQQLKELGFTTDFAPVADLYYEGITTKGIGSRSFGSNPEAVINLCKAAIHGLLDAGINPVLKHAPGHGLASKDSHHELPYVSAELGFLQQNDFWIFKRIIEELKDELPSHLFSKIRIMTCHIVYDCLDPANPVTASEIGLKYIKSGFDEHVLDNPEYTPKLELPVITDDLCMEGAKQHIPQIIELHQTGLIDTSLFCHGTLSQINEFFNQYLII